MRLIPAELEGVFEIELTPHCDERGFFARLYCPQVFADAGLPFQSTQINLSRNIAAYTLRGMHYQAPPFAEAKLVRAMSGSIYDVVVDIRPESTTFHRWLGRTLDARRGNALFVPEGFAHGFLTLEPDTDVLYHMSRLHMPGHACGFPFDDPAIGIVWPAQPRRIGQADRCWPPL